jgi:heme A synthase
MIYLLALLPVTALTIGGYVALFLSARSEGRMRTFGRYLGIWAFMLAGLLVLGAIFAAAHGGHRCPMWLHGMHEHGGLPEGRLPTGVPPPPDAPPAPRPNE